jgi:hypothetical protein
MKPIDKIRYAETTPVWLIEYVYEYVTDYMTMPYSDIRLAEEYDKMSWYMCWYFWQEDYKKTPSLKSILCSL